MFVSSCRTFTSRNSSTISLLALNSSNIFNKNDEEWIINSISLIIFILALLGNTAALVVMFGSRGPIRLTNNKYLVNLACADLLRACFMPFTIIARIKRNFMFGPIICKILPVIQGLSVAVDVFTLVCISVERYIAICRPLLILKLQSLRFANLFNALILLLIWTLGLLTALPNILIYNLCSLPKPGRFKCEKVNPHYFDERFYIVNLVVFYFLVPMLIMLVLYTRIICKMYKNNTAMKMRSVPNHCPSKTHSSTSSPPTIRHNGYHQRHRTSSEYHPCDLSEQKMLSHPSNFEILGRIPSQQSSSKSRSGFTDHDDHQMISSSLPKYLQDNRKRSRSNPLTRQESKDNKKSFWNSHHSRTNSTRSRLSSASHTVYRVDRHRRKALKLLIVIIVEFFICWTPLFLYHTFGTFNKKFYRSMPTRFVDLILLFSFASPLCNPLTYYFMSKRYRAVLYAYLSCCSSKKTKEKFNKKHQEAQQVIHALRLHQQQNSLEYKQKFSEQKFPSPNDVRDYTKIRSNTCQ